ncbi:Uncharacterised protein [Chlamydia trachomatis]|nr:Uncharacterised protein [Chlamydia trachomatis]
MINLFNELVNCSTLIFEKMLNKPSLIFAYEPFLLASKALKNFLACSLVSLLNSWFAFLYALTHFE